MAVAVVVLCWRARPPGWPGRTGSAGRPGVVAAAAGSVGDDTVVAEAASRPDALVVSADRGLRRRLPARVDVLGPSWLLAQLDGRPAS